MSDATEAMVDHAIAANLATRYSIESTDAEPRHADYAEAVGDGFFDIGIYVPLIDLRFGEIRMRAIAEARRSPVLAFTGANFEVQDMEWRISAKGSATDFEHDRSYYGDVRLGLMTLVSAYYGESIYVGALLEARAYPLDVDPLAVSDDETSAGICEECPEGTHPFAPFLPPSVGSLTDAGQPLVVVKIAPRGWYASDDES